MFKDELEILPGVLLMILMSIVLAILIYTSVFYVMRSYSDYETTNYCSLYSQLSGITTKTHKIFQYDDLDCLQQVGGKWTFVYKHDVIKLGVK